MINKYREILNGNRTYFVKLLVVSNIICYYQLILIEKKKPNDPRDYNKCPYFSCCHVYVLIRMYVHPI